MNKRPRDEEGEQDVLSWKQQKSFGKDMGRKFEGEQRDEEGKSLRETLVHPTYEQLRELRAVRYSRPGLKGGVTKRFRKRTVRRNKTKRHCKRKRTRKSRHYH